MGIDGIEELTENPTPKIKACAVCNHHSKAHVVDGCLACEDCPGFTGE